jgi:ATP-binding cassette subfamily C protein
LQASGDAIDAATEMYGFSREIVLGAGLDHFLERVCAGMRAYYRSDGTVRILPVLPKYALETIALCALFALPIYRSFMGEDVRPELATLGTFAYAAFRLLPVIQQLYSSATLLRYHQAMAEKLVAALGALKDAPAPQRTLERMPRSIAFEAVGYRYPGRGAPAVTDASFRLMRGERLAVIGPSGSGKSTLADLVLGLLVPSDGAVLVDGRPLGGGFAWKAGSVGYVPQAPLILRDTIARNIALGRGDGEIDLARCAEVAVKAGLADLIESEALGLGAVIGADIGNLSGGERQRLAIARALYSRPDLLVLDEPASALDVPMSRRLFALLCGRDIDNTVIVITHDIEYLPLFDRVVFMMDGRVVMAGPYEALAGCAEFRRFQGEAMARAR